MEDRLDRMGAFDAVMWGVEQDPLLRSVIVAMTILDEEPDLEVLVDRITRMTLSVPKLRERVIGNPISLIPPRWELDPNFDLGYHLKRFHVSADGTDRPLMRIAEQMAEQDFDRSRPLWEAALVQGWDGSRSAVIIKIHHAITDGVGGMAMAATLFDLSREAPTDLGPMPAEPTGQVLDRVGRLVNGVEFASRAVVERGRALAEGTVDAVVRVLSDPGEAAVASSTFAQSAARLLAPASEPLSPLMHGRSLSVHMETIRVPFRALRASAKQAGATLNDAYLAAVAGGVASYHEAHRSPAGEVRVNMPVNMRTGGDSSGGNRWVPARFPMPIDSGDAAERITHLSPILKQARTEPALVLSDTVYRLLTALPQSAATSISAGMMKGCDLAVTNVPGPPIPLYAAGTTVEAIIPFAPKAGAAVNIGLMTYAGTAFVGVNIDTRAIPDAPEFVEHLRAGFDQVLAIADPTARATIGLHSAAAEPAVTPQSAPAPQAPTAGRTSTTRTAKRAAAKATSGAAPAKAAAKRAAAKATSGAAPAKATARATAKRAAAKAASPRGAASSTRAAATRVARKAARAASEAAGGKEPAGGPGESG